MNYWKGLVVGMKLQNNTQSNFKRFVKENKTVVYTSPILIILILIVVIVYSNPGGSKPGNSVPTLANVSTAQGNSVEVLPQTERVTTTTTTTDGISSTNGQTSKNPFSGPLYLKGVVTRTDGNNMAIIEGNGKSYIVKKDDVIEGSLTVENISDKEVFLTQDDNKISLELAQRENNQTVVK
jgi:hypothetical protein